MLADFERDYPADGVLACSRLIHRLLDPLAEQARKPSWVEMTPSNVGAAATLTRVFPRARVLHMARDGRDVAARVLRRGGGAWTLSARCSGGARS